MKRKTLIKRWRRFLPVVLLSAIGLGAGSGFAQTYPSRPVRIVANMSAGGPVDTMARLISAKMADAMNQPVLVENRPGAGGIVGTDAVAKAAPDGYTILYTTDSLAISPALYRKLPFDAAKDFVPVTQLIASMVALVAGPKLPAASTRELIALAKSKPGGLNYGHTGVGSALQLAMELLKLSAGIDILAIPYKGVPQISLALMAGELDVAVLPLSTSLQSIKAGRLRALGVVGTRRSVVLPDVPTVVEAGVAGVALVFWHGLFVPAKTPRDIVDVIQREAVKALNMPDVRKRLLAMGLEIVGSTPEEFDAKFKADLATFARIIKEARVPLQD